MPSNAKTPELPIHAFANAAAFETFLEKNHHMVSGIHLKFAKKASGIQSISAAEAVETALCFGWIDGQANSVDDRWWTVRYTPRRPKSIWSQKNVNTVARLVADGRMRPAGLACVEEAKGSGRWAQAYAGPATITVPDDLTEALNRSPSAAAFFAGLNKSDRYAVLWRIETASVASRANRIEAIVQMLATGTVPGAVKKNKAKKAVISSAESDGTDRASKGKTRKPSKAGAALHREAVTELIRRPGLRSRKMPAVK